MSRRPARTPLPHRLVAVLTGLLDDGTFPPGSRLPPERVLGERLGVGRSTLRLALAELEAQGRLDRHQGRGTFVARPRVDADAAQYFTLSAALRASGGTVTTRTLGQAVVPAGSGIARDLDLAAGDPVIRIERLRLLDGEPVILERAELPAARFAGLETASIGERSLYDLLREGFGCVAVAATETLEPVVPTAAEAALLDRRRGAPALLVRRVTTDADDVPFEVASALVRGDRSRFLLQRRVDGKVTAGSWVDRPRELVASVSDPRPRRVAVA